MTVLTKALVAVGAFILAGFALAGFVAWHDRRLVDQVKAESSVARRDTVIADLGIRQREKDTVYIGTVRTYTQVRDRTLAANPNNQPAHEIAKAADKVVASGDSLRAVSDTLRDSLTAQVTAIKKLKKLVPARASAFVLGGYDWYNAEPVAQVGGDFRVVGSFSVTGFLEVARGDAPDRIKSRGVIAAKFTFR